MARRYMPARPARSEPITRKPHIVHEWTEADEDAAQAEEARQAEARLQSIDILQGSFGCSGCTSHYRADIYWPEDRTRLWMGDGYTYCGVVETVARKSGETDDQFYARAERRAYELEDRDGMPDQCRAR